MPTSPASPLNAAPGDRILIRGHHVGDHRRDGEIIEVLGKDGAPPYVVRWEDTGHVSRFYPSSDAYVHHFERRQTRRQPSVSPGVTGTRPDELAAEWEAATPPKDS